MHNVFSLTFTGPPDLQVAPEQKEDFCMKESQNGMVCFDSVVSPAGFLGQQFLSLLSVTCVENL